MTTNPLVDEDDLGVSLMPDFFFFDGRFFLFGLAVIIGLFLISFEITFLKVLAVVVAGVVAFLVVVVMAVVGRLVFSLKMNGNGLPVTIASLKNFCGGLGFVLDGLKFLLYFALTEAGMKLLHILSISCCEGSVSQRLHVFLHCHCKYFSSVTLQ